MTQQGEAQGPDPLVGQTVAGKYKIVKLLGEGGMGCVYLAEQQLGTSTRKVALKTLHKHLSHDKSIKARFNREAGTVAALEHPNTIQVFDFGEMPDGTLYLVMEFVQGKSVADILIDEGPMQPARVENIMRQVCGSLEEAHSHGIIHRDLKPDNVVLCERAGQKDWVEVLDFGIAKRSSEHDPNEAKLTQQGMVLGTPPYMSPEQFTGQPVDTRSDIYALGVMAYEMLTGKLPWEANTAWEWASKHMTEPPQPLETQPLGPHVPEKMRHAIARALAKNREERFASVKEFFQEFSHGAGSGTAVLGANGAGAGAVASPAEQPVSSGGPPRAKTEMAQPAMMPGMGGPPAGAMTPPYGAPSGAGPAGPAHVPAGPSHSQANAQKGGGKGLIIGLAALAALLLVGGGIAALASRSKKTVTPIVDTATATTVATDTASGSTAAASVATGEVPTAEVTGVAPLGGPTAEVTPKSSSGGAAPAKTEPKPTPTPHPAAVPTPTPPKGDPPAAAAKCAAARAARARNSPAAASLEGQCRALGGTP
jgi:serine/threonine-protein kinase